MSRILILQFAQYVCCHWGTFLGDTARPLVLLHSRITCHAFSIQHPVQTLPLLAGGRCLFHLIPDSQFSNRRGNPCTFGWQIGLWDPVNGALGQFRFQRVYSACRAVVPASLIGGLASSMLWPYFEPTSLFFILFCYDTWLMLNS